MHLMHSQVTKPQNRVGMYLIHSQVTKPQNGSCMIVNIPTVTISV